MTNYKKLYAIKSSNIKKLLTVNNQLNNDSGIYILTRMDEQGFKFAYVGQARHILDRLASHLTGYQHIDLSIKKHGFKSDNNPYGYAIDFINCEVDQLDELEKQYIKKYADAGYQLRNKTLGGQGSGKNGLDNNKSAKGYYDGLKQGYANAIKDIKLLFDKYLIVNIKGVSNKIKERKLMEFYEIIK